MYEYVRVVCAFPSAVWQMEILCVFFRIQELPPVLWVPLDHCLPLRPWDPLDPSLPWVPEVLPDRLRLREYLLKERLLRLYPKIY
ncbi:hypothetical protein [Common midwife toad virus]|uniref:Uncharacterized protein n=2 Tax=Ranavirus TaxID=10492 RepID=A0A2D0XJM9_9VIRU|nr:hypothetical protein [Common midwife toad virus]ASH97793.1 hypothetical protein [Common midwife toad virus]ASH97899.1 hypothetical protein [Common midwife toad virus]ASH98003.1 hypothetical protein [Common midwife toad virus]ASH98119.1 hypothetical protein [Common midwife toad virus]